MTSCVVERVHNCITKTLGIEPSAYTTESSFLDDLEMDSLDVLHLVVAIDEEFEVDIPESLVVQVKTVQDAIDAINKVLHGDVARLTEVELSLPLEADEERCLGHAPKDIKDCCPVSGQCARYKTISHPNEPWDKTKAPWFIACPKFNNQFFVKIKK